MPYYDRDKMNALLHFYGTPMIIILTWFDKSFDRSEDSSKIKILSFYYSSIGVVSGQLDGFSPGSQNLADKCKLIFYFSLDFVDAVFKGEERELIKLKEKFSSVADGSELIEFQFK
jgi:hypothetical protein